MLSNSKMHSSILLLINFFVQSGKSNCKVDNDKILLDISNVAMCVGGWVNGYYILAAINFHKNIE